MDGISMRNHSKLYITVSQKAFSPGWPGQPGLKAHPAGGREGFSPGWPGQPRLKAHPYIYSAHSTSLSSSLHNFEKVVVGWCWFAFGFSYAHKVFDEMPESLKQATLELSHLFFLRDRG